MAISKKTRLAKEVIKAEARDRKKRAAKRMRVSGKGVFTLNRLK